jgi:cell division protease FtsH
VVVPLPDVRGREQILKVHSKKVPLSKEVDLGVVARGTPGFSGADLENLINEAALMAARFNKKRVGGADLEAARDKLMMGVERKSMIMSPEEKKTIAWHEAGHALVSLLSRGSDPLHKVSIIPRGRALGVTQYLPTEDKHTYSRDYFTTRLATMMGGRVAEELALNQMTTGAGADIETASKLARNMVCRYGMSDVLGPISFKKQGEQIFLGREIAQHLDYSEETARIIDAEVNRLVMDAYNKAKDLISRHLDTLKALADVLLIKETVEAEEAVGLCREAILAEGLEVPVANPDASFTNRAGPVEEEEDDEDEDHDGPENGSRGSKGDPNDPDDDDDDDDDDN